jgi:putative flippase GtrA
MRHLGSVYQWAETTLGARTFKLVRYLIAGGAAAATHLAVLFLLVHFGSMNYVPASTMGFVVGIVTSFTMQKFLTFQDRATHDMHTQFVRYLVVTCMNLALNTFLVYVLVEQVGMWYMLAQTITIIIVAITGYVGYSRFVFRNRSISAEPLP